MKRYFIAFTLAITPALFVMAQTDKEKVAHVFTEQAKKDKIIQLINQVNPNDISNMMDGIVNMFESALQPKTDITKAPSSEPNPMAEKFKESMGKLKPLINEMTQQLQQDLVPVYAKCFTNEDLEGQLAFYASPSGKRIKSLGIAMMKEMMPVIIKGDVGLDNAAIPDKKRKKLEMLAYFTDYKNPSELDSIPRSNAAKIAAPQNKLKKNAPQKSVIDLNTPSSNILGEDPSEIMSKMHTFKVGYYNKNLSDDDLENAITFYQSPIGQKSIEVMPTIVKESSKIYAEKYQPQIMEKIQSLFMGGAAHTD